MGGGCTLKLNSGLGRNPPPVQHSCTDALRCWLVRTASVHHVDALQCSRLMRGLQCRIPESKKRGFYPSLLDPSPSCISR